MLPKLAIAVLALSLVAETSFMLTHRRSPNRFKPVEGYDGFVAFDTGTGQLCKTLRARSETEMAKSNGHTANKVTPCSTPSASSGDPILNEIDRLGISKSCGGSGAEHQLTDADSIVKFVAKLPACADIR